MVKQHAKEDYAVIVIDNSNITKPASKSMDVAKLYKGNYRLYQGQKGRDYFMQAELYPCAPLRVSSPRTCAGCRVWFWRRTNAPDYQPQDAGKEEALPHRNQGLSHALENRGILQV